MKRKLTLDEAWEKCMSMWERMGAANNFIKYAYIHKSTQLHYDCYFCEYARQNDGCMDIPGKHPSNELYNLCSQCPGYLVSKTFCCEGYKTYDWHSKPHRFLKKLRELYKRYKEQKA